MTNYISLERSKTPEYIFYHFFVTNYVRTVIDSFMTRVLLRNLHHNRSSDLRHKMFCFMNYNNLGLDSVLSRLC